MPTTVTRKGQVTLPKAVRDAIGAQPGTRVDIVARGKEAIVRLAPDDDTARKGRIAAFLLQLEACGPNPDGLSTDEYMAQIRETLP